MAGTRSGLVGSLHYGSKLTEAEADKIRFYFNYDMIGSPKPSYTVYADNDAHRVGASPLLDYLKAKGKPAETKYEKPRHLVLYGCISDVVAGSSAPRPTTSPFSSSEFLHLASLPELVRQPMHATI